MSHFSNSTIFSPTLARQALATTKDWNYVDAWLSRHFHPGSPPPFERNADTLRALLALAAVNESVDEENDILSKVEARCLSELRQNEEFGSLGDLLEELDCNLTRDGKASLNALTETAAAICPNLADTEKISMHIMDLQNTAFNLEQINSRIDILHSHTKRELKLGTLFLQELNGDEYLPHSKLGKQTMEYQRKAKLLSAKLPELQDRIYTLAASERSGILAPTVQVIRADEAEFRSLQVSVKDLEEQSKGYHGLPHDTDLARLELETLRAELATLKKGRDSMFESLVERESPKKQMLPRR